MKRNSTLTSATYVFTGVAIGALAMFMLDPVQGNRRRALARDKIYSAKVSTGKWVDAKSQDVANRTRGVCAKANRMLSHSQRPAENQKNSSSPAQQV